MVWKKKGQPVRRWRLKIVAQSQQWMGEIEERLLADGSARFDYLLRRPDGRLASGGSGYGSLTAALAAAEAWADIRGERFETFLL